MHGYIRRSAPRNEVVEMAFLTTRLHGRFGLSRGIYHILTICVMQLALTILTIAAATAFLVRFFYRQLNQKNDKCSDCVRK